MASKSIMEKEQKAVPQHLSILQDSPIATAYKINFIGNFYSGPVYKGIEAEFGLTRPEFIVLICLGQMGELTAKQIIEASGRPRNSISRAVIRLTEQGMISRAEVPEDRRHVRLQISAAGRRLLNKLMPRFVQRQRQMFSVLTPSELREFDRILLKLAVRHDDWIVIY